MNKLKARVLVLGATGMLGSTLFRALSRDSDLVIFGSIREKSALDYFPSELHASIISNIYLEDEAALKNMLSIIKPHVVINCIGIIKQLPSAKDNIESIAVNASFPHRLAKNCKAINARLIHFSTDCVFSGKRGLYTEEDEPDASDLYGRTKLLGEVYYENCITLRTSIIGHEINRAMSLVDWFLSQSTEAKGFTKAIFSGLPTIEIARVVKEFIIPNNELSGLYHLSVDPISKFELLKLLAQVYGKDIKVIPHDKIVIDRSLNSNRFRAATGFKPRPWPDLIKNMHEDYVLTL
jgi:dTDP-4-dehydrorhamnose reductase